jgi:hypothetical protein
MGIAKNEKEKRKEERNITLKVDTILMTIEEIYHL